MGLLSRRRSGGSADGVEAAAAPPVEPSPPSDEPVFRAATPADIPDWAKLPPLRPSLPEMPKIVPNFEPSLVSWQPPKRFLGELGHSISPSGPSGLVEGMTVLSPPQLASRPEASDDRVAPEPLPLAASSAAPAPKASVRVWRLPWNRADPEPVAAPALEESSAAPTASGTQEMVTAEITPDVPSLSVSPDQPTTPDLPLLGRAPAVEPAAAAEPQITDGVDGGIGEPDAPVADVVGAAPLTPVIQPMTTAPEERPDHRFVRAPAPPDMPLAQLPSALLPAEAPRQTSAGPLGGQFDEPTLAIEPVRAAPPAPTSGLVGQRAIATEAADLDRPPSAEPERADRDLPRSELPLASPSAPPGDDVLAGPNPLPVAADSDSDIPRDAAPPIPAAGEDELPVPAPLLGEQSQHLPLLAELKAAPPPPSALAEEANPAGDLTLARQPSEEQAGPTGAAEESIAPLAPLLGQATPVVSEPEPLVSPPPTIDESLPSPGGRTPAPASLLNRPGPPAVPRSGLGEPMSNLPSSARSWNISSMSPAQQLQMSRAMIHRQTPGLARKAVPPSEPGVQRLLPSATEPDPASFPPVETVLASTPLARAALEPEVPEPDVSPGDIPPAGTEQAPLLSLQPLVGVDVGEPGPGAATPSPEGARVRTAIGQRHGVDLSQVPLDRTPRAALEVRQLRARAFTSDRAVVIPPDVGTLEAGPGEALFAHELTHVAQRARFGPNLPAASSPAGRLLEAEALSAEMGLATAPLPVADLPGRSVQTLRSRVADGPSAGSERGPVLPLAATAAAAPDAESLAASIVEKLSAPSPAPALGQPSQVFTPPWLSTPAPPPPVASVQRADPVTDITPSNPPPPEPIQQEQAGPFMNRPSDEELSNLSRWLYPLIKHRLKGELREDRERAGLLTDHYRRW